MQVRHASLWSQAQTERQLRYKEKVTELRKKRNSTLNKEQKEKHIVRAPDLHGLPMASRLQVKKKKYISCAAIFSLLTHPPALPSPQTSDARTTAKATERAGSRCWRTSPATTTWSCSGKRRHVPRRTL